jgi:hypothetical protein
VGTIPTNHGDHYLKDRVYPACATCVARLTAREVAALDNILARNPRVEWTSREYLRQIA